MKLRFKALVFSVLAILGADKANALFVPVPLSEDSLTAVYVGADARAHYNPSFKLNQVGASAAVVYNFFDLLEVGLQAHGGTNDLVRGLFKSDTSIAWNIGADVMVRYISSAVDLFFYGLQGQIGYDYLSTQSGGVADKNNINVIVGMPLGIKLEYVASLYVHPSLEFGARNLAKTGVWGGRVGGSVAIGTTISFGEFDIIAEFAPRTDDLGDASANAGFNAYLGAGFAL